MFHDNSRHVARIKKCAPCVIWFSQNIVQRPSNNFFILPVVHGLLFRNVQDTVKTF